MSDVWDIAARPWETVLARRGLLILRDRHPANSLWIIMIAGGIVLAWSPRITWWRLRLVRFFSRVYEP